MTSAARARSPRRFLPAIPVTALLAPVLVGLLAGCACPGACGFDRSDARRSLRYAADSVGGHFCRDQESFRAIVTGIPDAFARDLHDARQGLCAARSLNSGCGATGSTVRRGE